ncbi:hypothetical protein IGB42_04151 [Andreprevotia sp. IGB-42]|uniref:hypothetical protein n=1 Tax=Andreprevotia sp. IGB-42 TaxID=2497473 RepID=UPI0013592D59|nr:hypothetical protein [Andreprevotia sp. IGB-42]KAF0811385.1 hypothetical protein IGB42_04151 [Andreprevotia sp. IGB-42]
MKPFVAAFALISALLAAQAVAEPPPLRHEPPPAKPQIVDGIELPAILHVAPDRDAILAAADILIFWGGSSKFGNLFFKHNGRWYATGGFIGNVDEFIEKEARISGGTIVYVSDASKPFAETKYGMRISLNITGGANAGWRFFYTEEYEFGEPPAFRHYYDEQNRKIEYADY